MRISRPFGRSRQAASRPKTRLIKEHGRRSVVAGPAPRSRVAVAQTPFPRQTGSPRRRRRAVRKRFLLFAAAAASEPKAAAASTASRGKKRTPQQSTISWTTTFAGTTRTRKFRAPSNMPHGRTALVRAYAQTHLRLRSVIRIALRSFRNRQHGTHVSKTKCPLTQRTQENGCFFFVFLPVELCRCTTCGGSSVFTKLFNGGGSRHNTTASRENAAPKLLVLGTCTMASKLATLAECTNRRRRFPGK